MKILTKTLIPVTVLVFVLNLCACTTKADNQTGLGPEADIVDGAEAVLLQSAGYDISEGDTVTDEDALEILTAYGYALDYLEGKYPSYSFSLYTMTVEDNDEDDTLEGRAHPEGASNGEQSAAGTETLVFGGYADGDENLVFEVSTTVADGVRTLEDTFYNVLFEEEFEAFVEDLAADAGETVMEGEYFTVTLTGYYGELYTEDCEPYDAFGLGMELSVSGTLPLDAAGRTAEECADACTEFAGLLEKGTLTGEIDIVYVEDGEILAVAEVEL